MITEEQYNNLKVGQSVILTNGEKWTLEEINENLMNPFTLQICNVLAFKGPKGFVRVVKMDSIDHIED